MSFQEKSAYVMVVALLSSGGLYFYQVLFQSMQIDEWISPVVPGLVQLTVIMVIVAIIGHIVIASLSSLSYKESQAKLDERERQIFNIAGRLSGFILGFIVILSLGNYLMSQDGSLLFYSVFAGLIVSQLAEYVTRIFLYRSVF